MTQLVHFFIAMIVSGITWDLFLKECLFPKHRYYCEEAEEMPGSEIFAFICKIFAQIAAFLIFAQILGY